jgi:hypothetical protein
MKSATKLAVLGTVVAAALAGAVIVGTAAAEEARPTKVVAPMKGLMLDVGSKHTVSYFTADDGLCNLTLVVGEKANEEGDHGSVGARVRMAIEQGKSARIETAEGKSLEFACARDAQSMSVRTLDLVAYSAARK